MGKDTNEIKFYGLQKTTLLDYPGYVACILFTRGCNMRCPFCHNKSLLFNNDLKTIDVWEYLEKRKGLLDGVVISGGEPLLYDTGETLSIIKDMGYKIKLDTNGSFPDKLETLIRNDLVDYVAMDIKHEPEKYALATGVDTDMNDIQRSIDLLLTGQVEYEFRTTVVRGIHTEEDMMKLAEWINGTNRYYIQQYRKPEIMVDLTLSSFSDEEMKRMLKKIQKVIPNAELRGVE